MYLQYSVISVAALIDMCKSTEKPCKITYYVRLVRTHRSFIQILEGKTGTLDSMKFVGSQHLDTTATTPTTTTPGATTTSNNNKLID